MINAVIIEDEAISRRALKKMVEAVPWLRCCGEAGSVRCAIEVISETRPDVVFLDINLPGGSGLDVVKACDFVSSFIFTTAHSEFAVDAFDYNAVDYLLKPFSSRRFDAAIVKLADRVFDRADPPAQEEVTIFLLSGKRRVPLNLSRVFHFSACDDYVVAHCDTGERLLSSTLAALEDQLDSGRYIRVHRSHIVDIRAVKYMRQEGDRKVRLFLRNGNEVVSSRSGTQRLKAFFAH